MPKQNTNQLLKIIIYGYDAITTETVTRMFVEELFRIKADFIRPIPKKTKRKLYSLMTGPFKHKDSQEQFQ
jgi:ribosomal protein S10